MSDIADVVGKTSNYERSESGPEIIQPSQRPNQTRDQRDLPVIALLCGYPADGEIESTLIDLDYDPIQV